MRWLLAPLLHFHPPTSPPGGADLLPGEIMLQNLPSLVAACVLGARPGERVLDACAAPGGKTTAIAQLMGDEGEVRGSWHCRGHGSCRLSDKGVASARMSSHELMRTAYHALPCCCCCCQVLAFDRTHNKAADVRRLAEAFGLRSVRACKMDATKALEPGADPALASAALTTLADDIKAATTSISAGMAAAARSERNCAVRNFSRARR